METKRVTMLGIVLMRSIQNLPLPFSNSSSELHLEQEWLRRNLLFSSSLQDTPVYAVLFLSISASIGLKTEDKIFIYKNAPDECQMCCPNRQSNSNANRSGRFVCMYAPSFLPKRYTQWIPSIHIHPIPTSHFQPKKTSHSF